MNVQAMTMVLNKIKEYDKILLFRHFRPDGDAVGSTKGLQRILQLSFPQKETYLQNIDFSDYLEFLGPEDPILPEEEYKDALGIVLDTGTAKRVSNQNFTLCKEYIKIDHHIPMDNYAPLEWVEEERSSTCEMVAAFYDCFKDELKIDKEAATYVYLGMVTDSGRFRFNSVSGESMRLAGLMLEQGIDTDTLFAHLYLKDFEEYKFESYVYKKMKISENGVAYIYIDEAVKEKFNLSDETASTAVSFMDCIKGSLIWMAFIKTDNGDIRVRLRSRFVTINHIAERYSGGGHACAAGATVHSPREMRALVKEADACLAEYKANNKGWL